MKTTMDKIISMIIYNNNKIQLLFLILILICSSLSMIVNEKLHIGLILSMLLLISFETIINNLLIENKNDRYENNFYFYNNHDLVKFLKQAKTEVYIVTVTGLNLNPMDIVMKELTDRGVKLNFLLCNKSGIANMNKFSYSNDEQRCNAIKDNKDKQSAINRILTSDNIIKARNKGLVEVRLIDSFLSTTFVAVDLHERYGVIQCSFYQYNKNSHECPCIKFSGKTEEQKEKRKYGKSEIEGGILPDAETVNLYEYYKDIIIDMWENGEGFNGKSE